MRESSDIRTGAGVYLVRLLYADAPEVDAARWVTDTATRFGGRVERMRPGDGTGSMTTIGLRFPDEPITFTDGSIPMQVWLLEEAPGRGIDLDDDLQQTWDWPGAAEAVGRARAAIAITDLMASAVEPQRRLRVFAAAVAGLALQAPPLAIQWWPAQRMVDPTRFLEDQATDPYAFATAVNVRNFSISGRADEAIMDTMGMSKLGLPDVQVHFRGRDLDEMAGRIHGTARYLFDRGDVIADGHTVGEDRWTARHEVALVPPEREVLDLDPGDIPR